MKKKILPFFVNFSRSSFISLSWLIFIFFITKKLSVFLIIFQDGSLKIRVFVRHFYITSVLLIIRLFIPNRILKYPESQVFEGVKGLKVAFFIGFGEDFAEPKWLLCIPRLKGWIKMRVHLTARILISLITARDRSWFLHVIALWQRLARYGWMFEVFLWKVFFFFAFSQLDKCDFA